MLNSFVKVAADLRVGESPHYRVISTHKHTYIESMLNLNRFVLQKTIRREWVFKSLNELAYNKMLFLNVSINYSNSC